MANKVRSPWSATYDLGGPDELVLVAVGEFIETELELGGEQESEAGDYLEADDSEPLAFGRTKRNLQITVYRSHASAAAARDYCLATDLAIPVNARAAVTLSIDGGGTYILRDCVFRSWRTTPRRIGLHETATTYDLACGALSVGSISGPDPVGFGVHALTLTRLTGLLDATDSTATHLEPLATWVNGGTGANAIQTTAANRPTLLVGPGQFLSGAAGNTHGWLDSFALEPGSVFAVRWDGILPSYRPAARVALMAKWDTVSPNVDQRSFAVYLEPTGRITLAISTAGTAASVSEFTSVVPIDADGGDFVGIMVTKNGTALNFWAYPAQGWEGRIALGPTQTIPNLTCQNNIAALTMGSTSNGSADLMRGLVQGVQLWIGTIAYADSTVLCRDFVAQKVVIPPSSSEFVATSGTDPRASLSPSSTPSPVRFDGSNDHLQLATPIALNAVPGVTLVWSGVLNRVSGINDLLYLAGAALDPRVLLRVTSTTLELHVRRLDGEAATVIAAPAALAANTFTTLSASIDYVAGAATLFVNAAPVASGTLTSAGLSQASNSSASRIMAGAAAANPAAGDVVLLLVSEEPTGTFEHVALVESLLASA
jgi:hypothetical protein